MGRNIYRLQISTFQEYTQHIKCLVKVSEGDFFSWKVMWIYMLKLFENDSLPLKKTIGFPLKTIFFGRAYLEQASCQADEKLFYWNKENPDCYLTWLLLHSTLNMVFVEMVL